MPPISTSADIEAHLVAAEELAPHDLGGVQGVVGRLMTNWPNNRGIYLQLQRLADFITKTRGELSSLRPTEVKQEFISKATDELDAIVEGTASATHRIMDAADVIMDTTARMAKEDADKAMSAVNSIYEACTFQDITGQRVTKVVGMLKVIEDRIDKMVIALGELEPEGDIKPSQTPASDVGASQDDIDALFGTKRPAGQLSALSGPALPGQGTSQSEVDKILAGEDL